MVQEYTALKYLRLFPTGTRVYPTDDGVWMISFYDEDLIEAVCSEDDRVEIVHLIIQGALVPDIVSDKEYAVQRAVGSVDHRTYRLQSGIAAKYQFSYNTSYTLRIIENSIVLCDYNIFDDSLWPRSDGQKYLEIIPRDGTKVKDYQDNPILNPTNEIYYIDQSSFDDMYSRGIIILHGHKWKLSRKYWEFRL